MREKRLTGFRQKTVKGRWLYLLAVLMLASLFQYALTTELMVLHEIGRQSAGQEWQLSGQMLQREPADCRVETRQQHLLEGGGGGDLAARISVLRRLRLVFDPLLSAVLITFLCGIYLRSGRRRKPLPRVRMIRYIQCSDGL